MNNITKIDSLEIVGAGVSVETLGNHSDDPRVNLWKAVQANNGYIISSDANHYPTHFHDAPPLAENRQEAAIQTAMQHFMDNYPLPIAVVGANRDGSASQKDKIRVVNANIFVPKENDAHYTASGEFPGLKYQRGKVMNSYLSDSADLLWNNVFMTFDEHADIPAAGVGAVDGVVQRAFGEESEDGLAFGTLAEQATRPKTPRILSDSCALVTLVRRGRIDWLRPYAELAQDAMQIHRPDNAERTRTPSEFASWKKIPGHAFTPTPYITKPWTRFQVDQYDHLETLGRVHRPQVISYLDPKDGTPLKMAERKALMETALRNALAPLDGKMPARVMYDYGGIWKDSNGAVRLAPLTSSITAVDPEFGLFNNRTRGYDLAKILGELGAGSAFVAVALATMAGKHSGGATLVANLRRDDGASLLLITPPTAQELKNDAQVERPFWPGFYGFN
ncbi:type VI lipase adapter Tla3 domain-containing protein [Glaciimonas soli]|uniref:DUF2875 domain-containing protein n=1 Tax=Glaciimonas soli TaxID=2590999 RepID=A0A843YZX2_9BURK|nr:DUF2875 family protein [Glaciimonas soli]MQR02096.1 DUF2875 domain-containing protein [Glaciimonas soli]